MLREDCIHRINSSWMLFAIPAFDDTSNVTWPFGLIAGNFPHAEQATIDKSYSDVTCPAVITVSRYKSPTHGKCCTLECRDPCNAMQIRHVRPTFPITPPASFGTKLQSIIGTMQVTQNWTIPSQAIAIAILVSISTTQGLNLLKNKTPHNITSKYLSQLAMSFELKKKGRLHFILTIPSFLCVAWWEALISWGVGVSCRCFIDFTDAVFSIEIRDKICTQAAGNGREAGIFFFID